MDVLQDWLLPELGAVPVDRTVCGMHVVVVLCYSVVSCQDYAEVSCAGNACGMHSTVQCDVDGGPPLWSKVLTAVKPIGHGMQPEAAE